MSISSRLVQFNNVMTDNVSTAWEDCWWEDRVSQSVKGDLVVDLSRTTTPETIQFSGVTSKILFPVWVVIGFCARG